MSQGIGVMKVYWNHTYKHILSLTNKHCKQMKTAQAGCWCARGLSSKVCLTVSPVLKEVILGSDVGGTHRDNTFWQWRRSGEMSVCLDLFLLFH